MAPEIEDDGKSPQEISSFWQKQLSLADRDQQDWQNQAKNIVNRYRSERKNFTNRRAKGRQFNILYSNTETLKAALYGQTAKPDVRQRFLNRDPIGATTASIIERALDYCADTYDVDRPINNGVHDYLLSGRGVVRIEYEPVIQERAVMNPMTGMPVLDPTGLPMTEEFIGDQILREKHIYWDDYRQAPARSWGVCPWVAYREVWCKDEICDFFEASSTRSIIYDPDTKAPIEQMGPDDPDRLAAAVPMNWQPDQSSRDVPDEAKRAEVWQIWDKNKRQRLWIVKGYPLPLRIDPDPYELADFFPQPEPLRSIEDTESLLPTPEFIEYEDLADDLDEITQRISVLTRAMKRRGIYNQAIPELKRLARANDNDFIPVENYAALMEKGSLAANFQSEDISIIAGVLAQLNQQRDRLIQAIYEITGIADVMRGVSDPNETLGAQQMKAQFGSSRLVRRQREVQKWIRSLYKIKAEIIAEHFEPDVLMRMTALPEDPQMMPQIMQILRSDKLRTYRIDIETDSTILRDEAREKASITQMLSGVAQFLGAALPAVQQEPKLAPLMFEMLSEGVRVFKNSRKIEEVIDQTAQAIMQSVGQPKPPGPEQMKAVQQQQKMQQDAQNHAINMQAKAADLQATQIKAGAEISKAELAVQEAAVKAGGGMIWPHGFNHGGTQ